MYLHVNNLTMFPDVSGPQNLKKLILNKNLFNHFPSLKNIGSELEWIGLDFPDPYEGFTEFSSERLHELPQLKRLTLRGNHLKSWVDLCRIPWTESLELELEETTYSCSDQMILAELAEAAGRVTFTLESPKCSSLSALVDLDWSNIQLRKFISGKYSL